MSMNSTDKALVATRGLHNWTEHGICHGGTYRRQRHGEANASILVDWESAIQASDNQLAFVWNQPNLDLTIPAGNVRGLFDGCIGHEGSPDGHEWDGDVSALKSTDNVGLDVFLAMAESLGAVVTRG